MKKIIIAMFALTAFSVKINAQLKVGSNATTITANTNLEVEATNGSKVQVSKDLGKVTIKDGTQAVGKVLTSDASGVASWMPIPTPTPLAIATTLVIGTLGAGATIAGDSYNNVNSGSYITLPTGKWLVTGFFILSKQGVTGASEAWWIRATFTDTSTGTVISSDITGRPNLISGILPPSSFYAMANGTIIINNTSSADKTYYLIASNGQNSGSLNTTGSIVFGSSAPGENVLYANQIK